VCGAWLGIGLGLFVGGGAATLLVGTSSVAAGGIYRVVWGTGWGVTVGIVSNVVRWILRREAGKVILPAVGSTSS
jgi:ABC-type sugar transport system permease subunit